VSASTLQPRARREHRIIERPRLIKLLDECDAQVILLLAPAGYGKTTLARQWAKTLTRSLWITCTPGHRDVATFAEDLAQGLGRLGNVGAEKFVREYVRAQGNPQRSGRRLGAALADQLTQSSCEWLIVDDYHEVGGATGVEELVEGLQAASGCHLVVASRTRPTWASSRRIVYGELAEVTRDALAMTADESAELLGRRSERTELARRAQGWPAVLALAAAAEDVSPPSAVLPSALHRYLAEEIYQSASDDLRERLLRLALLPSLHPSLLEEVFGSEAPEVVERARDLGFVSGDEPADLHPLLREFLIEKLCERPEALAEVHDAIHYCLEQGHWAAALALVSRFSCDDLIEPALRRSFKPLARSGRIGTLSSFASEVRLRPTFPPPSVDVVEAEVALRDGHLELAADLAARARVKLAPDHPLRSRASALIGHSNLVRAAFADAESAFGDARVTATDDPDEIEAIHGDALARIIGEHTDASSSVRELLRRRHESPTLLVRATTAELVRRRFTEGLAGPLPIEEARHALPQVEDPRARTFFTYLVADIFGQRAEYDTAEWWLESLRSDVEEFDLEFARPHADWTAALLRLGVRRFREAERLLQSLEDGIANGHYDSHRVNARTLRARMLMQTGQAEEAVQVTAQSPTEHAYPSWRGEYLATRALGLAVLGRDKDALSAVAVAAATSSVVEVRVLCAATHSVLAAHRGRVKEAATLLEVAREVGTWDPVVCALRASRELSDVLGAHEPSRPQLEALYVASKDLGLARRAGFRTRSTRAPDQILSPREREVLELIARGLKNREIAKALYISDSTAKVHVRHVLEKLGVRTRAEAVSRYEMFKDAE
jgi:LuxR family transcriptional regulator, maltose regulon positive regulatory protein